MMPTKSLTQQLAALDQHVCVALPKLLKQMRRPLNVSEEQRDGSRRQVTHSGSFLPRFIGRSEGRALSHRIILDKVAHNTQGVTYSVKCTMPFDILSMHQSSQGCDAFFSNTPYYGPLVDKLCIRNYTIFLGRYFHRCTYCDFQVNFY